jgi:hypothetical protein
LRFRCVQFERAAFDGGDERIGRHCNEALFSAAAGKRSANVRKRPLAADIRDSASARAFFKSEFSSVNDSIRSTA